MRPIDADELKNKFPIYRDDGRKTSITCHMARLIIDNTPTLEVVPMDFHERCLGLEVQKRIELEKRMPRWISMKDKDKTPEIGSVCLVYEGGIQRMALCLDSGWWCAPGEFITNSVDYWMPLPEPPKEDEDEADGEN